jgi:hypothetical protein
MHPKMQAFTVFFRTSKRFGKTPLPDVDTFTTLCSLLQSFDRQEIVIIADNAPQDKTNILIGSGFQTYITQRGNCGSYKLQLSLAKEVYKSEYVYFVEEDHLHLPNQKAALESGLEHFDIVSMYDHPDKYSWRMYKELSRRIIATRLCHFGSAPSTVMTFGMKHSTLIKHYDLLISSAFVGDRFPFPQDMQLFEYMRSHGIQLGTPIPGLSTHCEISGLSPYVDWASYANSMNKLKSTYFN